MVFFFSLIFCIAIGLSGICDKAICSSRRKKKCRNATVFAYRALELASISGQNAIPESVFNVGDYVARSILDAVSLEQSQQADWKRQAEAKRFFILG